MSSSSNTRSTSERIAVALLLAVVEQPVAANDLNPLLAGFDAPDALPAATTHSLEFSHAVANISLDQGAGSERVQLDAEVSRSEFTYTRRISPGLGLQVTLPWIAVGGGTLDSFIEHWHRAFNLPNGNRSEWPVDRLFIEHRSQGQTDFHSNSPTSGMGDISLRTGWQLSHDEHHPATLWLSVKLQTGNANRLTGSGTTDVSLSLSASQQPFARIASYEQASAGYLSHGTRLSEQQRNFVFSGVMGADLSLSTAWKLNAQLSAHSAIYDSGLRALGNSLQLHFGPVYERGLWRGELLISEDIDVDTAPDVQFRIGLSRRL